MTVTAERIKSHRHRTTTSYLFMKGVPAAPQCGFSATVVQILSGSRCHSSASMCFRPGDPRRHQGVLAMADDPATLRQGRVRRRLRHRAGDVSGWRAHRAAQRQGRRCGDLNHRLRRRRDRDRGRCGFARATAGPACMAQERPDIRRWPPDQRGESIERLQDGSPRSPADA